MTDHGNDKNGTNLGQLKKWVWGGERNKMEFERMMEKPLSPRLFRKLIGCLSARLETDFADRNMPEEALRLTIQAVLEP